MLHVTLKMMRNSLKTIVKNSIIRKTKTVRNGKLHKNDSKPAKTYALNVNNEKQCAIERIDGAD